MLLSMRACVSMEERYLDFAEAGMNLALIRDCRVFYRLFSECCYTDVTTELLGICFSFSESRASRGPFSFSALRSSKNTLGR